MQTLSTNLLVRPTRITLVRRPISPQWPSSAHTQTVPSWTSQPWQEVTCQQLKMAKPKTTSFQGFFLRKRSNSSSKALKTTLRPPNSNPSTLAIKLSKGMAHHRMLIAYKCSRTPPCSSVRKTRSWKRTASNRIGLGVTRTVLESRQIPTQLKIIRPQINRLKKKRMHYRSLVHQQLPTMLTR